MAAARPLVTVFGSDGQPSGKPVPLPSVFLTPVRADLVNFVFANMNKNRRQAYSVNKYAGEQTSAESWGTGRAVSRIPRVGGGGTHRSGQGAFGNMCRGGRMFSPNKIWRRWHRRINIRQRRFAVTSALAASACAPLVKARGHRIDSLREVPLVVETAALRDLEKTKDAQALLGRINVMDDIKHVKLSRSIRAGKGKMRNRRYVQRLGPLVIYNERGNWQHAIRNVPGIEVCHVSRMNLLQLAPGGHVGRFIIWTRDAFEQLNQIYGSYSKASSKNNFTLSRGVMATPSLQRIINSDEVQSVVRPATERPHKTTRRSNPLKNKAIMDELNPYAAQARQEAQATAGQKRKANKAEKAEKKDVKKRRKAFYEQLQSF